MYWVLLMRSHSCFMFAVPQLFGRYNGPTRGCTPPLTPRLACFAHIAPSSGTHPLPCRRLSLVICISKTVPRSLIVPVGTSLRDSNQIFLTIQRITSWLINLSQGANGSDFGPRKWSRCFRCTVFTLIDCAIESRM